jgi:6-phosphogluconolactonase (cycloisomerase 2 family)
MLGGGRGAMMTKAKSTIFFSTFLVMVGVLLLSSCGYHYKCGVTFGSSTCNSSGSGLGTTGSSSGNTAFAYSIAFAGSVNGAELTGSNNSSLQVIPNFTSPTVPASEKSAEIVVVPKKFVYAMFPASQKLFAWSISATTGDLVSVSGSPFSIAGLGNVIPNITGVNYSSMAVNPAGTFLFFAYAGSDQIDAYQIGTTGTLTQVSGAPFSTGTLSPYNLSFDGLGNYLYATAGPEGNGGQVAAFSIGSSGALTAVQGSPFSFNMWMLQGDPSGKYMIGISGKSNALNGFADDDSLYVFNIQQSGSNAGALTQVSGSPFATVTAPINLAVQPVASNGNFVYSFSVNPLGPNPIEGYQLDTNSGTLTAMTGSPFANLGTGYWGQFDQSGANLFIFANTTTASSLGILSVASGTGVLTEPLGPVALARTTYFAVTDAP